MRLVEGQPIGGQINQSLDDENDLRPAGASVGRCWRRVREGAAATDEGNRDVVDGRQNPHSLLQGHEGGSVGAEIASANSASTLRSRP